jgi:hypothetical protein
MARDSDRTIEQALALSGKGTGPNRVLSCDEIGPVA